MLTFFATLPKKRYFQRFQVVGDRFQWADSHCDRFRILSRDPKPWGKEFLILLRAEQPQETQGVFYPKKLSLVCFSPELEAEQIQLILSQDVVRDSMLNFPTPQGRDRKAVLVREITREPIVQRFDTPQLIFSFKADYNESTGDRWLSLLALDPKNAAKSK